MANECKEKIVDTVKKVNGELKRQFKTLKDKANLLKSVIISKESEVLNINSLHNKGSCGSFENDDQFNRQITLNLFSDVKPYDKIENQIKIHSSSIKNENKKKNN